MQWRMKNIGIKYSFIMQFGLFYTWLRLTHPTLEIEPDGRMRCAISSMSSVSAALDTLPR